MSSDSDTKKTIIDMKSIITAAIGGILLFMATIFLNAFVSSPPTRAEFDSLKAEVAGQYRETNTKLDTLQDTSNQILNAILHNKPILRKGR